MFLVGIGTPDGASTFTEAVPFPKECLICDPNRLLHDTFSLTKGLSRTFLNKATPEAIQKFGFQSYMDAAKEYKFVKPPSSEAALQQGGTFAFSGSNVLFSHIDQGTADHASIPDLISALQDPK